MAATTSWRSPFGFTRSMARPRLTCSRLDQGGLAVLLREGAVHRRHGLDGLHHRVADEVREGDLPAAGALEVVVDDDAVVEQQLHRDRAHGRGRGQLQRGVHVLRDGGGRDRAASRTRGPRRAAVAAAAASRRPGAAFAAAAGAAARRPASPERRAGAAACGRAPAAAGRGGRRRGRRRGGRAGAAGGGRAPRDAGGGRRGPRGRGARRSRGGGAAPACSRRRSPTRRGLPNSGPGGTAGRSRRRATRSGRNAAAGFLPCAWWSVEMLELLGDCGDTAATALFRFTR